MYKPRLAYRFGASTLWQQIGSFQGVGEWHPMLAKVQGEGEQPGTIRTAASKFMSKLNWGDTRIVAIPTVNPQWAASFLHDTGLKASTSLETEKLRKAFQFVDPPFGVALEDGRVKGTFGQAQFNAPLPEPDLKRLEFVK